MAAPQGFIDHMNFMYSCINQLTNEQVTKILHDYQGMSLENLNEDANTIREHLGLQPYNYIDGE